MLYQSALWQPGPSAGMQGSLSFIHTLLQETGRNTARRQYGVARPSKDRGSQSPLSAVTALDNVFQVSDLRTKKLFSVPENGASLLVA